jgi:predicted nuclease of predicted toxin-antitoxin system
MRFLVDAQLPKSLSDFFNNSGYDSIHTLDLPEGNMSTDSVINTISVEQNRIVVTKDADFLETFLVKKLPPRLILVKTGNIKNSELLGIFRNNLTRIGDMLKQGDLIEITRDEIILHQ